jgi:group II intron reverse transcriptase/maturase
MTKKLPEIKVASYNFYGKDNESLQPFKPVQIPVAILPLLFLVIVLRFHYLGHLFYVEVCVLIWSSEQITISNPKEGRYLTKSNGVQYRNSRSPDRLKSGGDGGFVVANRKFTSLAIVLSNSMLAKGSRTFSTKAFLPAGLDKLGKLRLNNTKDKTLINRNILDIVANEDVLFAAYQKVKSSPGNKTKGVDTETLYGIPVAWFANLKKDLRTNAFQFKPARRMEIPKPNGKGTRPLGIASPRDKIVQAAMLLALEAIFEPSFHTHSHGFRAGKGCHSALKEVKNTFAGVNWLIEGALNKCFDSFDPKLLIQAVARRIDDKGFTDLLHKALRAGYLFQVNFFSPSLGTSQGSIVSPILCNILLHYLDEFILTLKEDFDKGTRKKTNPQWIKLTRMGRIGLVHQMNIGSRLANDPEYKRMRFVRYADDFLIGVIGSKAECEAIINKIFEFLLNELNIKLNLDKTKITHAQDSVAHFLGTDIIITPLSKRPLRSIISKRYKSMPKTSPLLHVPAVKLVAKLEEIGFAKQGGTPTRLTRMIPFETSQIVKHFWQIWLGISAYYSFADNYGQLGRIHYILKYSCVHTLASKLKLGTANKTFAKFGKNLEIRDGKGIIKAAFPNVPLAKPKKFLTTPIAELNPFTRLEKLAPATIITRKAFEKACTICQQTLT